jgi:hypothetical protein
MFATPVSEIIGFLYGLDIPITGSSHGFYNHPTATANPNRNPNIRNRLLEIISALDAIPLKGFQRRKMG